MARAPHILIVDDNDANLAVAGAFCEALGCEYDCARDGLEAVEAVRAKAYDLILMDIHMPRMDGITATRAIRMLHGTEANIPIIAVTANADPANVRAYLSCGMSAVVPKPIELMRLSVAMSEAMARPESDLAGWRPRAAR